MRDPAFIEHLQYALSDFSTATLEGKMIFISTSHGRGKARLQQAPSPSPTDGHAGERRRASNPWPKGRALTRPTPAGPSLARYHGRAAGVCGAWRMCCRRTRRLRRARAGTRRPRPPPPGRPPRAAQGCGPSPAAPCASRSLGPSGCARAALGAGPAGAPQTSGSPTTFLQGAPPG